MGVYSGDEKIVSCDRKVCRILLAVNGVIDGRHVAGQNVTLAWVVCELEGSFVWNQTRVPA